MYYLGIDHHKRYPQVTDSSRKLESIDLTTKIKYTFNIAQIFLNANSCSQQREVSFFCKIVDFTFSYMVI